MAASSEAFKVFRSAGVVVFANSKTDRGALPRGATEMLGSPKAGNTIPIVMVTTADGAKGLEVIPYKVLSDDARKAARDLRKTLEGVDVVGNGAAADPAPVAGGGKGDEDAPAGDAEVELVCEEREWTNLAGNSLRAAVVDVNEFRVIFLLPGGKTVDYPLSKLSEESQKELRELAK